MRQLARWTILSLLIAISLAGASLIFSPVRDTVWAALLLADMLAGDNPSLFKRLTTPPTVTSGVLISGSGLTVPFDLYRSETNTPAPALVFTHGLAHLGNRDPRITSFSRRLARAGFIVMAPDLLQMKTYKLGFRDVDALAASLNHLHGLAEVDTAKIGIFAPSFAAGPALIAISRPDVRNRVQWGIAFGGYYDLHRALRYTLTGAYNAEGHQGRVDLEGNRHNRWKFLKGNIDLLPASRTREAYVAFLDAKQNDPGLDILPVLPRFSEAERRTLVFINNEDPMRFDSLYTTVPASFHTWIDTLSMYPYTQDIKAHLLICHSSMDNKVHFTESLTLSQNLPNAPQPTVFIIGVFSHVDLSLKWDSIRSLCENTLPGLRQVWSLAYQTLRKRR